MQMFSMYLLERRTNIFDIKCLLGKKMCVCMHVCYLLPEEDMMYGKCLCVVLLFISYL